MMMGIPMFGGTISGLVMAIIALAIGILIAVFPRLLSYLVATFLIIAGGFGIAGFFLGRF